uniref:Uncharacterized protein n=1 Tax=Arundo donax TaxID=35708 RepID=A0A0A9FQR4_ARUDO
MPLYTQSEGNEHALIYLFTVQPTSIIEVATNFHIISRSTYQQIKCNNSKCPSLRFKGHKAVQMLASSLQTPRRVKTGLFNISTCSDL